MCNNATVVSYIKQEGGTKSFRLTQPMTRLLKFCDCKGFVIVSVHLPGRCKIQADSLSRPGQTLPTEWEIHPDFLRPVFSHWGQPWIDLFATFNKKKCHQFISPFPDPPAAYIDTLSMPWNRMGTVYAFPPFKIIPTVIVKLRQSRESITMILIALYRMDASGMLELLQLSWDRPIPVHDEQNPLNQVVHQTNGGAKIWTYQCLNLHEWKF